MLQLTFAGSGRKSLLIGKTSTVFTSTLFAFAWASSTRSAAVMQCIDVDNLVFSPPCGADRAGSVMDSTPEGEYAVMVYEPSPLASGPSTVSDVLDNAPSSSQGVNEEGRLAGTKLATLPWLEHDTQHSFSGTLHEGNYASNCSFMDGGNDVKFEPAFPRVLPPARFKIV